MKRLEAVFKPESGYKAFLLSIATFGLVTLKGPGTGTAEPEADDAERPGIPQAGTEERPEEEPADGTEEMLEEAAGMRAKEA